MPPASALPQTPEPTWWQNDLKASGFTEATLKIMGDAAPYLVSEPDRLWRYLTIRAGAASSKMACFYSKGLALEGARFAPAGFGNRGLKCRPTISEKPRPDAARTDSEKLVIS